MQNDLNQLNFNDNELQRIRECSEFYNKSVSEFVRDSVLARCELKKSGILNENKERTDCHTDYSATLTNGKTVKVRENRRVVDNGNNSYTLYGSITKLY